MMFTCTKSTGMARQRTNVKTKTFGDVKVEHDGYVVTIAVPDVDVDHRLSSKAKSVSAAAEKYAGIRSEAHARAILERHRAKAPAEIPAA